MTCDARLRTNEPLPYVLTPGELRALLGLGSSRFFVLQRQGAFDALRLDAIDGVRRYSGLLVERYLRGERVEPARRWLRKAERSHASRVRNIA